MEQIYPVRLWPFTVLGLLGILGIVAGAPAGAQGNRALTPGPTLQNPTPINEWDIALGYAHAFESKSVAKTYYHVEYRGKLIEENGTPPAWSAINVPLATTSASSDSHDVSFRLDRGGSALGSGFFDDLGSNMPLPFKLPKPFRGAVQLTGRLDGKHYEASAGLEVEPLHLLNGAGIPNWLIFGANSDWVEQAGELGSSHADAKLTYRFFAGRGFHWVTSSRFTQALPDAVLRMAPSYVVARALATSQALLQKVAHNQQSAIEDIVFALGQEDAAATAWESRVRDFVRTYNNAKDQPSYALWLETGGWDSLTGRGAWTSLRMVVAATARFWINPKQGGRQFVQARYEYGFNRSDPGTKRNLLLLSVGLPLS
ncbi:MAG: hypothetical protein NVSMB52_11480 [Chloroflexota bacterium]